MKPIAQGCADHQFHQPDQRIFQMARYNLENAILLDAQKKKDVEAIIKRLYRKMEIMKMDQKASGSNRFHDTAEMITLLDMLSRQLGIGK